MLLSGFPEHAILVLNVEHAIIGVVSRNPPLSFQHGSKRTRRQKSSSSCRKSFKSGGGYCSSAACGHMHYASPRWSSQDYVRRVFSQICRAYSWLVDIYRRKIDRHILPLMCSKFTGILVPWAVSNSSMQSYIGVWHAIYVNDEINIGSFRIQFMDKTTLGSSAILGILCDKIMQSDILKNGVLTYTSPQGRTHI